MDVRAHDAQNGGVAGYFAFWKQTTKDISELGICNLERLASRLPHTELLHSLEKYVFKTNSFSSFPEIFIKPWNSLSDPLHPQKKSLFLPLDYFHLMLYLA